MRIKHAVPSAFTLFLAGAAAAQSVPISNPGFENNWDGWTDEDPSAISSLAYAGNRSAKITGSAGRATQQVSLNANTNYELSAFVRGKGTIGVEAGSASASQSVSSNDWQKVTVSFNSGSQTSADIYAAYFGGDGRFDAFELNEVDGGTPPPPTGAVNCTGSAPLTLVSATDDGTNDGNVPAGAIDGNLSANSRWSSLGSGKQLVIDLGTQADIKEVDIAWFKGNQRQAFFEIDTSSDGNSWTTVLASAQSGGQTAGFESFNVNDSDGRYVRITGDGNTSNNWNSVIEVRVDGCTEGGGPIDPPTTDLNPALPPSGNFDLLDWTISVPIDENNDGKADTIKEVALSSGYSQSPWFYTGSDGGMVFRSNVSGAKTSSNTSYTRSELREMLRRGDTNFPTKGVGGNNWVFGSAPSSDRNASGGVDGTLTATLAVNHVTTSGSSSQVGRVIIGQIHANDDEPLRLYYRKLPGNSKGAIYFAHEPNGGSDQYVELIGSRSSSVSNPSDGIELDEKFSYRVDVVGDDLTVTIIRPGKPDVSGTYDMSNSGYNNGGQYMYFKAGVYNQNNTGNSTDYVQATFYALDNKHTGYAF